MIFKGLSPELHRRPLFCYIFRSRFHYYQALCFGIDATQFREEELVDIVGGSNDYALGSWSSRTVGVQLLQDREQCTEMHFLKRHGLPFYICVLDERLWLDGLSGQVSPPPARELLLRGAYPDLAKFYAEQKTLAVYNCQRSLAVVDQWLAYFTRSMKQDFLKRRMNAISFGEMLADWPELSPVYAVNNQVFVRTMRKQRNGFAFVCSSDPEDAHSGGSGPWEWKGVLEPDEPCVISAAMDLQPGFEYRCFIIDGQVSSVSRLVDFELEEQNNLVLEFASRAAAALLETTFVRSYTMDIALTSDDGMVIVDINPIGVCGRYVNNRVDWLIQALYGEVSSWSSVQYAAFQASVDSMARYSTNYMLRTKAEQTLDSGNLMVAEVYYREFMMLPSLQTFDVVGTCLTLSQLLRGMGRHDEALRVARQGVVAAKASREEEHDSALLVSIHEEARCLLNLRQFDAALELINEGYELRGWMNEDSFMRAILGVLKAECLVGLGRADEAEATLQESEKLYQPYVSASPSLSLVELKAEWWSVYARVRLSRGDGAGAKAAWEEAVRQRELRLTINEAPIPRLQYAETLMDLQAVCRAIGDLLAAQEAQNARQQALSAFRHLELPAHFGEFEKVQKC